MPRSLCGSPAPVEPAVNVVQLVGLYVGVPALLFGAIALVVLASTRPTSRTGSPVLRRRLAPSGDEQAAPADAPEMPLGSRAGVPSVPERQAGS